MFLCARLQPLLPGGRLQPRAVLRMARRQRRSALVRRGATSLLYYGVGASDATQSGARAQVRPPAWALCNPTLLTLAGAKAAGPHDHRLLSGNCCRPACEPFLSFLGNLNKLEVVLHPHRCVTYWASCGRASRARMSRRRRSTLLWSRWRTPSRPAWRCQLSLKR